jgi:hypothetical protein
LTAGGGWPATTDGCTYPVQVNFATNAVDVVFTDFDQSTKQYQQWTVVMPSDWNAGTVTATPYWTAASGTGDVIWGVQGRSYGDNAVIDAAFGTAQTSTDTLQTANYVHIGPATSAITLAGTPAAGQLVQYRLYRDAAAGGDTLTATARLSGILITFTRT